MFLMDLKFVRHKSRGFSGACASLECFYKRFFDLNQFLTDGYVFPDGAKI